MKKYVMLTPAIGGMGGSQMFCNNKAQYLKANGWEIVLIYFQKFDVLIEDLNEFSSYWVSELGYGIQYLTSLQRKHIVTYVCGLIGAFEECVIESHMVKLAMWGELIAADMNCIHILNPIEEELHPLTDAYADFMEFKLRRHELLNASEGSLKRFFRNKYREDFKDYIFEMIPYCSNVTSVNQEEKEFSKSDYTILSIGRLDKPYIMPMVEEICSFCKSIPDKIVNIIFIGASTSGIVEKNISSMFSSLNCNLYLEGYKFPVPYSFLENSDVAIACANSVLVSADNGLTTIVVDAYDYDAIGVYGYTTKRKLKRDDEERIKISVLLKEILIEKKYEKSIAVVSEEKQGVDNIRLQIEFANISMANQHQYYNVENIYSIKDYLYCNLKRIGHKILRR